jgi:hypothetical protein
MSASRVIQTSDSTDITSAFDLPPKRRSTLLAVSPYGARFHLKWLTSSH